MRDESGWTIVEVLIVAVLLVIVLGGTLNLLDTTAKVAPQEEERAQAVREAQVGLARMTRELRQATKVVTYDQANGVIKVEVNDLGGVRQTVTYDCSGSSPSLTGTTACRRTQVGGSSNEVVIDRVKNNGSMFTRIGTNFFQVRVEVPASGERAVGQKHSIVLDDGFYMRNIR